MYFSPSLAPPTGNKEKHGWLRRLAMWYVLWISIHHTKKEIEQVFDGSVPTCAGFHLENFYVTCLQYRCEILLSLQQLLGLYALPLPIFNPLHACVRRVTVVVLCVCVSVFSIVPSCAFRCPTRGISGYSTENEVITTKKLFSLKLLSSKVRSSN